MFHVEVDLGPQYGLGSHFEWIRRWIVLIHYFNYVNQRRIWWRAESWKSRVNDPDEVVRRGDYFLKWLDLSNVVPILGCINILLNQQNPRWSIEFYNHERAYHWPMRYSKIFSRQTKTSSPCGKVRSVAADVWQCNAHLTTELSHCFGLSLRASWAAKSLPTQ